MVASVSVSSSPSAPIWTVAVTKPNLEKRAEHTLTRQGFVTYLPRFSERIIIAGRFVRRTQLLFPRYIFVEIVTNAWHSIARSSGIAYLLQSGDKPATLDHRIIEDMKARHDQNDLVELPKFQIGQRVQITSGPFVGQFAIYQGMTSHERESVLLQALGFKVGLKTGNLIAA